MCVCVCVCVCVTFCYSTPKALVSSGKMTSRLWESLSREEKRREERGKRRGKSTRDIDHIDHIDHMYVTQLCISRTHRLRRSQTALNNFEAALTRAENEAAEGPEKVNNERLSKAQAAKKAAAAAKREAKGAEGGGGDEEEEEEEVGEEDWERCTEESLAKALEEAKEAVNHSRSYLIGEYTMSESACRE